ncbi:MAG: response regulator transcription factor [Bacteroidales bacterium]|nr:response regulator transcription factor [Bacteroidales bacterium]
MEIQVLIVEDDHEIREWMIGVIAAAPGIACIGAYACAESCIKNYDTLEPDVVIMDIHMPGMNGIECIKKIKPIKPAVQFIMFTVFEDDDKVFESLCAGASGYILKNTTPEKLVESIKDLHNGGSPMTSTIARKVIHSFRQPASSLSEYNKLSVREKELLELLAKGYRYKEIAEKLFISVETVRTHIRNIYEKLQVQSRTEALNKIYPRG